MLVSINWLRNFISLENISNLKNLNYGLDYSEFPIDKLTLSGFELENLIRKKTLEEKDLIIEVDSTPNRSDITNFVGFIREIKSIMNLDIIKNPVYKEIKNVPNTINLSQNCVIINRENLNSFLIYQISNVEIKKSPNWLKKRILSHGINPQNFIIDLKNYIFLEWGQPINLYDLNKLEKLRKNKEIVEMGTCKVENYKNVQTSNFLEKSNSIIKNTNKIGLESIIEKKDCFIDENTTNVIIEYSVLDKKNVLKTNKNIVFQHFIKLACLLGKTKLINSKLIFGTKTNNTDRFIKINFSTVKEILGKSKLSTNKEDQLITNEEIRGCLKRLNFLIVTSGEKSCILKVSPQRAELVKSELDIIEEIGRIYGFNNLIQILPRIKNLGTITRERKIVELIKNELIRAGFNELFQYSFSTLENNKNIKLQNPLSNEYSTLRTTQLPSLIENINYNKNQRNYSCSAFEIGRIFSKINKNENTMVSGFFGGENYRSDWNNKVQKLSWYEGKELINGLIKVFGISLEWSQVERNIGYEFHPGRTAFLHLYKNEIGIFTQIHPLYAKKNNLSKSLFFFEINLTRISQLKNIIIKKYIKISIYPKISKDLSFEISNNLSVKRLLSFIKKEFKYLNLENLELNIDIFDNYQILNLPRYRKVGFKLSYQSILKTLIKKEIEEITELLEREANKYINMNK